jgi:hypothetical protein
VLRLQSELRGHSWSPGGKRLLYQVHTVSAGVAVMALCLFDPVQRTVQMIRKLGVSSCTFASQGDEQSVAWSARGTSIIVVDTCGSPSLYFIDRAGRDLAKPRSGTFARWLTESKVLFRMSQERQRPARWVILDVTSGRSSSTRIPAGTFRPTISQDGRLVAFDDGNESGPSLYVHDLSRGMTRRLATGYGAPVWLGPGFLAATKGGACPAGTECNGWWVPLSQTAAVDPDTGGLRRLSLQTTIPQPRLFSVIQVFFPN